MKGFKPTGKGPKYGSFTFPSAAGFGPSSGKVKSVSGYSRRAPKRVMKKAVGGIVEDNIVEAPGFSDYAKGGIVSDSAAREIARSKLGAHFTEKEFERIRGKISLQKKIPGGRASGPMKKARGGKVPGVSDPMTAREAMSHFSKGGKAKRAVKTVAKKFKQYQMSDFDKPIKGIPDTVGYLSGKKTGQQKELSKFLETVNRKPVSEVGFNRTPKIGK